MAERARTQGLARLESFSDAVFAIALTLLVLDLLPHSAQSLAAILLFAVVILILSIPWLALDVYLGRRPSLLVSPDDARWMRGHARASIGTMAGALIGFGISFVSPLAALVLYLIIGAAFLGLRLRESSTPREPRA